jgi:hypothetical protein
MAVRAWAMWSAVLLAGCPLSTPVLEVPVRDAQSLILVTVAPNGDAAIEGISFVGRTDDYVSVPVENDLQVYALHYSCALEALMLGEGPQPLAPESEYGRPLPEAAQIYRAEIADGRSTSLEPIDAPAEISELRLRTGEDPCVPFEATTFEVPDTSDQQVPAAFPLGGDRALLVTSDARFFEVSPTGITEQAASATTTLILGAFRANDGEMLLLGTDGRTLRGKVGEGFVAGPRTESREGFGRTSVAGDPSRLSDVFMVDAVKSFERFSSDRWTRLNADLPPAMFERGATAWLGPGRAAAIGLDLGPLVRFDNGALTAEPLPIEQDEGVRAIGVLPTHGLLLGTTNGALLRDGESGWERLHDQLGALRTIDALDQGVFFGGQDGNYDQLYLRRGACGSTPFATRDVAIAVSIENGFVLVTDLVLGEPTRAVVLIRKTPPLPQRCPEE